LAAVQSAEYESLHLWAENQFLLVFTSVTDPYFDFVSGSRIVGESGYGSRPRLLMTKKEKMYGTSFLRKKEGN
jgi:hypothetical protein